ncbi:MAG TPA: DUF4440 domain-containing protein [Methylophilaceae bacterium]|nr:DUF4440 domain-containing protein [Methylophilaceae bacterium]
MQSVLTNDKELQATFTKMNASWNAAFNAKNAALVASFYDAAATVMPAGGPQTSGKDIQGFWENVIGMGFTDHSIDLIEVISEGNLAFQRATWSAASVEASGEKKTYAGSLQLTYLKQADGSWKVLAQIWN